LIGILMRAFPDLDITGGSLQNKERQPGCTCRLLDETRLRIKVPDCFFKERGKRDEKEGWACTLSLYGF
jgi:hypothetical protein